MVLEPQVVDAVATRIIDPLAFTDSVEMFFKNEVEKCSFK